MVIRLRLALLLLVGMAACSDDVVNSCNAARHQPRMDIQTTMDLKTLPTDEKILVYCRTGQTSSQLTGYLSMLGYDAYSLLYGVQDLCYDEEDIDDPMDAHPVVP